MRGINSARRITFAEEWSASEEIGMMGTQENLYGVKLAILTSRISITDWLQTTLLHTLYIPHNV